MSSNASGEHGDNNEHNDSIHSKEETDYESDTPDPPGYSNVSSHNDRLLMFGPALSTQFNLDLQTSDFKRVSTGSCEDCEAAAIQCTHGFIPMSLSTPATSLYNLDRSTDDSFPAGEDQHYVRDPQQSRPHDFVALKRYCQSTELHELAALGLGGDDQFERESQRKVVMGIIISAFNREFGDTPNRENTERMERPLRLRRRTYPKEANIERPTRMRVGKRWRRRRRIRPKGAGKKSRSITQEAGVVDRANHSDNQLCAEEKIPQRQSTDNTANSNTEWHGEPGISDSKTQLRPLRSNSQEDLVAKQSSLADPKALVNALVGGSMETKLQPFIPASSATQLQVYPSRDTLPGELQPWSQFTGQETTSSRGREHNSARENIRNGPERLHINTRDFDNMIAPTPLRGIPPAVAASSQRSSANLVPTMQQVATSVERNPVAPYHAQENLPYPQSIIRAHENSLLHSSSDTLPRPIHHQPPTGIGGASIQQASYVNHAGGLGSSSQYHSSPTQASNQVVVATPGTVESRQDAMAPFPQYPSSGLAPPNQAHMNYDSFFVFQSQIEPLQHSSTNFPNGEYTRYTMSGYAPISNEQHIAPSSDSFRSSSSPHDNYSSPFGGPTSSPLSAASTAPSRMSSIPGSSGYSDPAYLRQPNNPRSSITSNFPQQAMDSTGTNDHRVAPDFSEATDDNINLEEWLNDPDLEPSASTTSDKHHQDC